MNSYDLQFASIYTLQITHTYSSEQIDKFKITKTSNYNEKKI